MSGLLRRVRLHVALVIGMVIVLTAACIVGISGRQSSPQQGQSAAESPSRSMSRVLDDLEALRTEGGGGTMGDLDLRFGRLEKLVEELDGFGPAAQRTVACRVREHWQERSYRYFWLPILLGFGEGSLAHVFPPIGTLSLEDWEWRILAGALPHYKEEWAYDAAIVLAQHGEVGVRANAVRALVQWHTAEASEIVIDKLKTDGSATVRAEAAKMGGKPVFSGAPEQVKALIAALTDASGLVNGFAEISLRRVVSPARAPERRRITDEEAREWFESGGPYPDAEAWQVWWVRVGHSLRWNPDSGQLEAAVPQPR